MKKKAYICLVTNTALGKSVIACYGPNAPWMQTRYAAEPLVGQLLEASEGDTFEEASNEAVRIAELYLGATHGHLFTWREGKAFTDTALFAAGEAQPHAQSILAESAVTLEQANAMLVAGTINVQPFDNANAGRTCACGADMSASGARMEHTCKYTKLAEATTPTGYERCPKCRVFVHGPMYFHEQHCKPQVALPNELQAALLGLEGMLDALRRYARTNDVAALDKTAVLHAHGRMEAALESLEDIESRFDSAAQRVLADAPKPELGTDGLEVLRKAEPASELSICVNCKRCGGHEPWCPEWAKSLSKPRARATQAAAELGREAVAGLLRRQAEVELREVVALAEGGLPITPAERARIEEALHANNVEIALREYQLEQRAPSPVRMQHAQTLFEAALQLLNGIPLEAK